jgi:hypothetical protein
VAFCVAALVFMAALPVLWGPTEPGGEAADAPPAAHDAAPAAPKAPAAADADRAHDHEVPLTDPYWYATIHGEGALAQVFAIDGNGRVIGPVLGPLPADQPAMDELRGIIALGDGRLAVMNAKSTATRVMLFGPPDAKTGIRPYQGIWTQKSDANPALVHPYQILVGPDGDLYAGNQDTNTITRYAGLGSPRRGQPTPIPDALASFGTLFPGTVVPNDQQSPEGIGLVRGFSFGPDGNLYVCDRGHECVSIYSPKTGRLVGNLLTAEHGLKHPIQVLFSKDGEFAYVSDNHVNCVWEVHLGSGRVKQLVRPGLGGLTAASSLAIRDHVLYVGSRESQEILKYDLKTGRFLGVFAKLPGNPEFFIAVNQQ